MTETKTHLRLHRPDSSVDGAAESSAGAQDTIERFWSVFASTTGYRIDDKTTTTADPSDTLQLIESEADSFDQMAIEDLLSQDESVDHPTTRPSAMPPVGRDAAQRIAAAGATITSELERMREAILRSEGELAMRASTLADADVANDLQTDLQSLMADAVAATGTTAAVLWMLDDDTETLRISSTFGVPPIAMATSPRPLRGSRGDLEAMVNRIVLADGRSGSMDTYAVPKIDGVNDLTAGICVVIRSADLPIGTLWLLTPDVTNVASPKSPTEAAHFTAKDAAAARLAATSIEQAMTLAGRDHPTSAAPMCTAEQQIQATIATGELSQWQQRMLPAAASLTNDWLADGWVESDQSYITGWHAWDVLPDGTLMLAVADIDGGTMSDAMAALTARTALQSHVSYRHRPSDMLRRISDTLWQSDAVMSPLSMFYAHIDPETGAGQFATAGNVRAIAANRYGMRPLTGRESDPIGIHVDASFQDHDFHLPPGDTLLAYDIGLGCMIDQQRLGNWMTDALRSGSQHPLAHIRRQLADDSVTVPLGAATLMRTV